MILQPIVNIAEICARKGVNQVVLSPGSRNAPLTLAFARHPEMNVRVISDERSAAFIGLGMAIQSRKTVALICTSGSAAYNYAPAVAEAFFQQVPLLVITADRPPEWIDQMDGQTIRQRNIYGQHVKMSFNMPVSYDHADAKWHVERIISEAINLSETFSKGPVHINVPLREPFYPKSDESFQYEKVKIIEKIQPSFTLNMEQWDKLLKEWKLYSKILIIGGQQSYDSNLIAILSEFSEKLNIPIVGDVISNLHTVTSLIGHPDVIFGSKDESLRTTLAPDLLITFGKSIISKNIKIFLRTHKPKAHWHIQSAGDVADTYQSLTKIIPVTAEDFFKRILNSVEKKPNSTYFNFWKNAEDKCHAIFETLFKSQPFGEFEAVKMILNALPQEVSLHLANSMSVRYANLIGLTQQHGPTEIFSNRGTSGIDGSNSTAVGSALVTDKPVVLITGDMAFFYDRNAFWHSYPVNNLRIVILNNHAGGIFRLIDGPGNLPELEDFFETKQMLTAKSLAGEFGFDYLLCNSKEDLLSALNGFFQPSNKPKILEIETDLKTNHDVFKKYKSDLMNINFLDK